MHTLNYNLEFTGADVARILQVDKKLLKKWVFIFSDYLSKGANPPKGNSGKFEIEDIRIMAYIFTCWEDDPELKPLR